jgi:hypothetical protein
VGENLISKCRKTFSSCGDEVVHFIGYLPTQGSIGYEDDIGFRDLEGLEEYK